MKGIPNLFVPCGCRQSWSIAPTRSNYPGPDPADRISFTSGSGIADMGNCSEGSMSPAENTVTQLSGRRVSRTAPNLCCFADASPYPRCHKMQYCNLWDPEKVTDLVNRSLKNSGKNFSCRMVFPEIAPAQPPCGIAGMDRDFLWKLRRNFIRISFHAKKRGLGRGRNITGMILPLKKFQNTDL